MRGDVTMTRLRVHGFSVSLDGYGAGPRQGLEHPLGVGGMGLHEWMFPTRTWKQMEWLGTGETGIDDSFLARGTTNIGAWILGRNMFGPVRGPWPDENWKGWWGDTPPYHVPVFVLTHHARPTIPMKGGTEFHFVTGGIEEALKRATEAAQGQDVRLGGGVSTIRQYFRAGLVDDFHFAIAPTLLGSGEHLFTDLDLRALRYECTEYVLGDRVTHVVLSKRA